MQYLLEAFAPPGIHFLFEPDPAFPTQIEEEPAGNGFIVPIADPGLYSDGKDGLLVESHEHVASSPEFPAASGYFRFQGMRPIRKQAVIPMDRESPIGRDRASERDLLEFILPGRFR